MMPPKISKISENLKWLPMMPSKISEMVSYDANPKYPKYLKWPPAMPPEISEIYETASHYASQNNQNTWNGFPWYHSKYRFLWCLPKCPKYPKYAKYSKLDICYISFLEASRNIRNFKKWSTGCPKFYLEIWSSFGDSSFAAQFLYTAL